MNNIKVIHDWILEKMKSNKNSYYIFGVIVFLIIVCIISNLYFLNTISNNSFYEKNIHLHLTTLLLLLVYIKVYTSIDSNMYYDFDKLFYKNTDGIEMSKEYYDKIEQLYNDIIKPMKKITSSNVVTTYLNDTYKKVYVLEENVLTKKECNWIIYESEVYAKKNGWTTKRHIAYPTVDNPIKNIEPINYFILNIIYTQIFPSYEKYYNIDSRFLGISDLFIVKYSVDKGMNELEYHEDGSIFSFIITLNDDFTGGGTRFINLNEDITGSVGSCVIFCGKNTHGGIKITSGTRYIIAGFLNVFTERIDTL
jgi:hypothetical protein